MCVFDHTCVNMCVHVYIYPCVCIRKHVNVYVSLFQQLQSANCMLPSMYKGAEYI